MMPTSIPWYESEDDFNAVLGVLPVSESYNAFSYTEWVTQIQGIEKDIVCRGQLPIRVTVKPSAIEEWCKARGLLICRKSIMDYAMMRMGASIVDRSKN